MFLKGVYVVTKLSIRRFNTAISCDIHFGWATEGERGAAPTNTNYDIAQMSASKQGINVSLAVFHDSFVSNTQKMATRRRFFEKSTSRTDSRPMELFLWGRHRMNNEVFPRFAIN